MTIKRMEEMLDEPISAILPAIEARCVDPMKAWEMGALKQAPDAWVIEYMQATLRHMRASPNMKVRDMLAFFQGQTLTTTQYKGVGAIASAFDVWQYRDLMHNLRPDVVVHLGVYHGGTTLWLADLCEYYGQGKVVAVDANMSNVHEAVKSHPRVKLILGDAVAMAPWVAKNCEGAERVLVIEDTAHTYDNTLAVLRAYGPLVTPGSMLVCEDTICYHGLEVGFKPGPWEAVETFLAECSDFVSDRGCEQFCLTWHPTGYLRKNGPAVDPWKREND